MGMIDQESLKFFAINEIFADMFNYAFWKNGVPNRVDHNALYEMDGKQIIDVVNGRYVHRFQRERDVVRLWRLTVGDETIEIPLILGLELQDYIHYALPVKVMMYDALTYTDQVRKASKSKAQVELTDKEEIVITDPNEFLSGFPKDGVLIPPITITVYLGNECWDAPLAIRKMWSPALSKVPELRDMMMQNYKSFFVNINDINDPEFQQFKTELSHVLLFAKNRKNMNALVDHTKQHQIIPLSNDAFDFLRVHGFEKMQRFKVKVNGKEGNDLCQAVQDLMKKGAEDVTVEYILSIMDHLHISEVEEACQLLSIPEDRWDMYQELVEKALAEKEDT